MKKMLSFLLSAAIIFTIMTPFASALGTSDTVIDSFVETDAEGNTMRFELVRKADDEYILNFFMNNVFMTSYAINSNSPTIQATRKAGLGENRYTLHTVVPEVMHIQELKGPIRWRHAGYVEYGYSESLDCDPLATISYRDTDYTTDTYVVDTYEESSYSDWVALITSTLISAGLALYAPATLAAGILAGLIGYYGGEVINDAISVLFIEEYDCSITTYTMRASIIGDDSEEYYVEEYEGGKEWLIKYVDAPPEYVFEGWTPHTWACRDFAQEIWEDCVPFNESCPVIKGYPTSI